MLRKSTNTENNHKIDIDFIEIFKSGNDSLRQQSNASSFNE